MAAVTSEMVLEMKDEMETLKSYITELQQFATTINLGALKAVLEARGELGFNMKILFEMGEEVGRGYSRKVSKATWKGATVAVKEDAHSASGSAREALREASLLFQLTESRNILKLVGLCNSTMVFEYAPIPLKNFVMDRKNDISVEKALSLGLDVVNGVSCRKACPSACPQAHRSKAPYSRRYHGACLHAHRWYCLRGVSYQHCVQSVASNYLSLQWR